MNTRFIPRPVSDDDDPDITLILILNGTDDSEGK